MTLTLESLDARLKHLEDLDAIKDDPAQISLGDERGHL